MLYCRAIDIRTKAYGPDHHDVGQALLSYSAFLLSVDAAKSAEAAKRAADIFEVNKQTKTITEEVLTYPKTFCKVVRSITSSFQIVLEC